MDKLPPNLRPLVQIIDDWNTNRKLGLLFECRVGTGRLLVCAADLGKDLDQRPAARQLRASLLAYMQTRGFTPKLEVPPTLLQHALAPLQASTLARLHAKLLAADSEDRAHGNLAAHALDGDPDTFWHTRWDPDNDPMPHHLIIDLGRELTLRCLTCLPRQDQANGRLADCDVFLAHSGVGCADR